MSQCQTTYHTTSRRPKLSGMTLYYHDIYDFIIPKDRHAIKLSWLSNKSKNYAPILCLDEHFQPSSLDMDELRWADCHHAYKLRKLRINIPQPLPWRWTETVVNYHAPTTAVSLNWVTIVSIIVHLWNYSQCPSHEIYNQVLDRNFAKVLFHKMRQCLALLYFASLELPRINRSPKWDQLPP